MEKRRTRGTFFTPIGLSRVSPGVTEPHNWEIMPNQEQVDSVKLLGWEMVRDKVIQMFTKEKK